MARVELLALDERDGLTLSASYKLSENAKDSCIFYPMFSVLDIQNSASEFFVSIEISDDGNKWKPRAGMSCSGKLGLWAEPPSISIPMIDVKGKYVRSLMFVNKQMEYKLEMENGV